MAKWTPHLIKKESVFNMLYYPLQIQNNDSKFMCSQFKKIKINYSYILSEFLNKK